MAVFPRYTIPNITSDEDFLNAYAKVYRLECSKWRENAWGNKAWELFLKNHIKEMENWLEQSRERWCLYNALNEIFNGKIAMCFMAYMIKALKKNKDVNDLLLGIGGNYTKWLWAKACDCKIMYESGFLRKELFYVRFHRYFIFHFHAYSEKKYTYYSPKIYWYETLRCGLAYWFKIWYKKNKWRGWEPDMWFRDDIACPEWQLKWAKILINAWYLAPSDKERYSLIRPLAREVVLSQGDYGEVPIVWYEGKGYREDLNEEFIKLARLTEIWKKENRNELAKVDTE